MKRRCIESARVQDFLDDGLTRAETEAFRLHLADCAECATELAAYRRLFGAIERAPLLEPGPALTERILAAVVPSRIRRRWLRTFGWTYAGSLAASLAAAFGVASLPGSRAWLDSASVTASRHTVELMVFLLNLLGYATLGIANGWGAVAAVGARIAPLSRAFGSLLQHPPVEAALWAAAVICVALLGLLHRGERPSSRGVDPLGIVGV